MRYVALMILALLIVFLLATIGRDLLFAIPGHIDSVIQGFLGQIT